MTTHEQRQQCSKGGGGGAGVEEVGKEMMRGEGEAGG